jgi:DNA-binding MarR family transcriptional regulator
MQGAMADTMARATRTQLPSPEAISQGMAGCTCMRLRKVTRRVTQIYDAALAPSGLTTTQFGLLAVVRARPGISIGDLAERQVMDPTTLTRTLRPLEKLGLIDIRPHPDDRRRRVITPTARSQAVFAAALPMWRKAQAETAELLGPRDLAALTVALDRSLAQLGAGGAHAPAAKP